MFIHLPSPSTKKLSPIPKKAAAGFPEIVCEYVRHLAEKSPKVARQCFDDHSKKTTKKACERYGVDPFGELTDASKCYALKQRFPDRVLVMTTNRCFANCRFCTRRGLLDNAEFIHSKQELAECVNYVKAHPQVRDVLLSGGDILTLQDEKVERLVNSFAELPQIDIVRVCTRALSLNPIRIGERLATILGRSKKVWVNTQFNCADELTKEAITASSRLIDHGVPVSCQTVLLKGVNDTKQDMLDLLKQLSANRIRPYYVFMCDPVAGIDHFRVPLKKALEIERYCAENIGGLSMPRFVADIPGEKRKIPISELKA